MAGPSVAVRILADMTGFSKSVGDTAAQGETAASRMKSAFSGMLSTLNQTGVLGPFGEALNGISESMDAIKEHGKDVGAAMMGVGGAIAGVGVGLSMLGSKDKAAHQQLQASIEATGGSYDDFAKQIDATIKHQENFGHSAAQTQDALSRLTQVTHDPTEAIKLMGTVSDVAAAKHMSLTDAAGKVGKAYEGNSKILKDFGITIDKSTGLTADHKTAMQALADVTAGQASAATDTFSGKLDALKTKIEDQVASLGAKYGPAITAVGGLLTGLGAISEVTSAIMASSWFAAFWPVALVIAAIAAVGVAIYLLRDKFAEVLGWIAHNWPIIVDIILGPLGIIATQIYEHFGAILNFFKGLPGQVASIFANVWGGIESAFRAVINGVIDIWNDLHFTLPKVDVLGVHIGGETIGVPTIPHLAQGGLVTQTGLIYAHAGEAITPIDKVPGRGGPLVQITGSTFNSATDVDMIAKKLEFAVASNLRLA